MARFVKVLFAICLLAAAGLCVWHFYPVSDRPSPPLAGKLVVLVVFDQMRGDYVSRWSDLYGTDGFELVKKQGTWYSACQLPYACSSTGPGHASIITGAPPSVHGIVENEWYDAAAGGLVYCAQPNRKFDLIPPLTGPIEKATRGSEDGFSADRLLAPTVGDALKRAHPESRVFSLSIKDRTAALMGGKTADGVYCFDTRDGRFHTGSNYRPEVHPWVAEFNASGRVNEWFDRRWERFRPELDYKVHSGSVDPAPGEAFGYNKQTNVFPHPFKGDLKAPGRNYYLALETSPAGNEILLDLATRAIEAEKLGSVGTMDLLCVSFSSNDLIGHQWGPDSWEVLDITLRSDDVITRLIQALDRSPGKGNYSLVITADHGVCPIPEQKRLPDARRVMIKSLIAELTAACDEVFGESAGSKTQWFGDGASIPRFWPWLSLNRRAIEGRGLTVEEVQGYVAQWLGNRPYALAALTRAEIDKGEWSQGYELPREMMDRVKLATYPGRGGDILFIPKPGVLVTDYPQGTGHGSPHPYDTSVPLMVFGTGVSGQGQRTGKLSSLAVAPILAKLLEIDPPAQAKEQLPEDFRK